jgi:hypothetical protein
MSSLFEQTHYAASQQIEDRAATTRTMGDELNALAKGLNKVADHVASMHPDTLRAWAGGADAATNGASLLLILRTAEDWARLSVTTLKQAKRVGGRGRTEDLQAKWMRETAAFVYKRLTDRKDNIAYDAYAGQERETEFSAFLQRIFKIYGLKASAKSRARKR